MNKQGNIASRLWQHKQRGREIRIPGGKSMYGDHASFGLIYREGVHGVEILVIPYDPKQQKLIIKEDEYPEDPRGTLVRELLEETGVKANQFSLLGTFPVPDNREGREDQNHVRHAYVVTDYDASNIRTQSPPSQRIFVPLWVPIDLLKQEIWDHHRWILDFFEEYYKYPSNFVPKEFNRPFIAVA